MRILVLNYEFPPIGGGGGRASAELCAALSARGHQIRLLTARASGLPSREAKDGYLILRVPSGRRSRFRASFLAMMGYLLGGLIPGLLTIRGWRPDVLHAHFAVPTGVLAATLSRLTGVPYVLTAHLGDVPGGVPEKTAGWFERIQPLTPPIWNRAAAVVAVSEYTKSLAQKHYDVPIQVIPNGIRADSRNARSVQAGDPPTILFAGRFQPQKNLGLWVEVLAKLKDLHWKAILIGDGPDRSRLESAISRHSLEARIERPGWLPAEAVDSFLSSADLLLMTSDSEGLPVIGLEALAHGLAIVATEAGGLAELVDEGKNGRRCPVGDRGCLEAGLRWCLEDRQRLTALRKASLRRAARYDIGRIAETYERLFLEIA